MVYIGMFNFVAKIEVIKVEGAYWTGKILKIYSSNEKFEDFHIGDLVKVEYGFIFNTLRLAKDCSKNKIGQQITGRSLLGLCY